MPRTRWLVAKLGLVIAALAGFGVALTAVVAWAWSPLDQVSMQDAVAACSWSRAWR